MTVTYGLTPTGFVMKPLQITRADFNTAIQNAFGKAMKLGDKSKFGQVTGILSETVTLVWELLQGITSSQDPDAAVGTFLEQLCLLTGTYRPAAAPSTATLTLVGDPTSPVPAGTRFSGASSGKTFVSLTDVTITAVPAWVTLTHYTIGDRVLSDVDRIYQCTVTGDSGAAAVSGTGADLTDGGTVHWKFVGEHGAGAVDVVVQAEENGATTAVAGDIIVIESAVTGLSSAINQFDATLGRLDATDEELRALRTAELAQSGSTPPDALRAALLKLAGIITATVFYNNSDFTDGNGVPPHGVECLVLTSWPDLDPQDQLIYDLVYQNVAAGIVPYGTHVGSTVDSQGTTQVSKFSRAIAVPIYVIVHVTKDPNVYPVDGAAQIQNAIAAYGAQQPTGRDAVSAALAAQAFKVDGVLDVTACYIGTAPAPGSSATVAIDSRHFATYAVANISVVAVDGTP